MRVHYFLVRNWKEIIRDPVSSLLGLMLPLVLQFFFLFLNRKAPLSIFEIQNLAPGMIVFGFTFLTMFSGVLVAKDRKSSFLLRLFASPMRATDFILGYAGALLPLALLQCILFLGVGLFFGLTLSLYMLATVFVLVPQMLMSIFAGILFGSLLSEGQQGGVGSIYITLAAMSSGAWLPLDLIGGVVRKVAFMLPFARSVEAARITLGSSCTGILPHVLWASVYAAIICIAAIAVFNGKMRQ